MANSVKSAKPVMGKASPISLKKKVDDSILVKLSATETNYFAWRKTVKPRVTAACPNVVEELLGDPPTETADEKITRLSAGITWPVELDERTDFISDEAYERVIAETSATRRSRAEMREVAAIREVNRVANVAIRKQIIIAQQTLKNLADLEDKKRTERLTLSALLVSKEYISSECLKQLRAHGDFDKANDANNSPFRIMRIIKTLFSGGHGPSALRQMEQENVLRAIRQGNVQLHVYVESFMDQIDRCGVCS